MEKFSEIKYVRPNIDEFCKTLEGFAGDISSAKSAEEIYKTILAIDEAAGEIYTMFALAHIRNTLNTNDEFYDGEVEFMNEEAPKTIPARKMISRAILDSPYLEGLKGFTGEIYVKNLETDDKLTSEAIIPDLIEQSSLCADYRKLAASCKTVFEGEECNFYGLLKFMESPNRETRRKAFVAWAALYEGISEKLDEIYDKLVKVRVSIAKKQGFDSYIDYRYLERGRYDYTSSDIAKFREEVRRVIVPLCVKLRDIQAKRIGVDKLKYFDETYMYPDGNADPIGDVKTLVGKAQQMYRELSPETGEFFDFMVKYELFDLETRPGKHLGGYCSGLEKYKAPFIFSNFNGTSADADVLTHEAGHAFQSYVSSRTWELSDNCGSTSEINEIHSMSMEFFTYPWMESFFGENTAKYREAHLTSCITTIPYLVSVDEFQHRVFEKPDMTADERYAAWHEIELKYLPWRDYDGVDFLEKGGFWMQKQHIFLYPFYYIDYALAQLGALEYFGKMLENREAAWQDYLRLCRAGGSKGYFELLKIGALSNQFDKGSVEKAVLPAAKVLGIAD